MAVLAREPNAFQGQFSKMRKIVSQDRITE